MDNEHQNVNCYLFFAHYIIKCHESDDIVAIYPHLKMFFGRVSFDWTYKNQIT